MTIMNNIILLCILFFPILCAAQQKVEAGIFGGFANYQGDLVSDPIALSETKVSYGAFLRYQVSDKLKAKINVVLGFISGADKNDKKGSIRPRGWSFSSNLLEVSVVGEYHPFGRKRYGETGLFRRQVSPYAFAGFGMINANPKVSVTDPNDAALFPESDFNATSLCFPVGLGVRVDLLENISIGFEGGWRPTLYDYLDGVSQTGNPDGKDLYVFFGATLSYFFGSIESFDFGQ